MLLVTSGRRTARAKGGRARLRAEGRPRDRGGASPLKGPSWKKEAAARERDQRPSSREKANGTSIAVLARKLVQYGCQSAAKPQHTREQAKGGPTRETTPTECSYIDHFGAESGTEAGGVQKALASRKTPFDRAGIMSSRLGIGPSSSRQGSDIAGAEGLCASEGERSVSETPRVKIVARLFLMRRLGRWPWIDEPRLQTICIVAAVVIGTIGTVFAALSYFAMPGRDRPKLEPVSPYA
jgi:hypothetical protein